MSTVTPPFPEFASPRGEPSPPAIPPAAGGDSDQPVNQARWADEPEQKPSAFDPVPEPSSSRPQPAMPPSATEREAGESDGPGPVVPAKHFWESEGTPAALISLMLHTLLLIILALWQWQSHPGAILMTLAPAESRELPQLEPVILPTEILPDSDSALPESLPASVPTAVEAIAAETPTVPDFDIQTEAVPTDRSGERSELTRMLSAAPTGPTTVKLLQLPSGGLAPRTAQSRAELGEKYGATRESENAVEMALAWLAEHQQRDGSWSFDLSLHPCNGRCSHSRLAGDNATPNTAATGLALLSFLGAGYTHREGKYVDTVRNGIYYLRDAARPAEFGLDLQAGSMYGHGIATLALTEANAIDHYHGIRDEELRELCEGVVLFTLVAQHQQGGWRYRPGQPGDMTVSAWQVLSLISARYGDIPLRTTTLSDAKAFVNSLSAPGSYQFGYVSRRPQRSTTAIGLCMLLYLGDSPQYTPFTHALEQLAQRGPTFTDLYHDYYATMVLHNARHHRWDEWHRPLRDHLVRTQALNGHERGSWHFRDPHGDVGGRLYSTAMAAMILEVYYRYLPLYQDRDDDFRLP